jgi:CASC3/Barentsz eIF4AIII binding
MPPSRRRLAPRRNRADDGEEEGSVVGDLEDDSLSDGSAPSAGDEDGDAEASDASLDEDHPSTGTRPPVLPSNKAAQRLPESPISKDTTTNEVSVRQSPDHDALVNRMKSSTLEDTEELQHDDTMQQEDPLPDSTHSVDPQISAPKAPRSETLAQKSRREHQEYLRERNSNPAFVPNRGGFFLHDDRSSTVPTFNTRTYPRGKGRDFDPTANPVYVFPPYSASITSADIVAQSFATLGAG